MHLTKSIPNHTKYSEIQENYHMILSVFVKPNKDHYIIAYQPNVQGRYNLVDDIVLPTCFFVPVHPRDLHKPIQTFINNNLSKCRAVGNLQSSKVIRVNLHWNKD